MNVCDSFRKVMELKFIPANCIELSLEEVNECVRYSDWKQNQELDANKVVCDNPVWVARNSKANLYSSDGTYLYITSNGRSMGKFVISGDTKTLDKILGLGRDENIKKFSDLKVTEEIKEGSLMDKSVQDKINAAREKAKQKGGMNAVSIDATGAPKERDAELEIVLAAKENAVRELTSKIANVKLADTTEIKLLNSKMGTLVGYIVEEDAKIVASAVSVADKDAEGHKIKKVDAATVADVATTGETKVSKDVFVTHKEVSIKHKAPRKIHGVILKLPEAGIVDYTKLNDPNATFEVDYSKTGYVYLAQPLERAAATISKFFTGAKVKEDPTTHPEPDFYSVTVIAKPKKAAAGDPVVYEDKIKMSSGRKGSAILPTNYIPRKVPKTVSFSTYTKGAEAKKLITDSLFYTIAKSDKFDEIQNNPVQRTKDGIWFNVTSDFTEGKKPLAVNSFFGGILNDIQVPVKNIVATTKNDATRAVAVSYDVLGKNEGLEELNPLTSKKFEVIRKAAGGNITAEMFREVIPQKAKGNNAKSKSYVYSAEETEKIITAGLAGVQADTLEALESQMRNVIVDIKTANM